MSNDACWATVICSNNEHAALTPVGGAWVLSCELETGHPGPHAADGAHRRSGSRNWLLWNDSRRIEIGQRRACAVDVSDSPCYLFEGHPGAHLIDWSHSLVRSSNGQQPSPPRVSALDPQWTPARTLTTHAWPESESVTHFADMPPSADSSSWGDAPVAETPVRDVAVQGAAVGDIADALDGVAAALSALAQAVRQSKDR